MGSEGYLAAVIKVFGISRKIYIFDFFKKKMTLFIEYLCNHRFIPLYLTMKIADFIMPKK